jgi:U3 small nucleolar RNA-associated protein MPP10
MASSLVSTTLESSPHEFLQPSLELHSAALALAKFYLDPVAAAVSSHQQSRLDALGQDRKRKRDCEHLRRSALRLKHLTLPGFDSNQVWEQARRIIDGLNQQAVQANEEQGNEYETVSSEEGSGGSDPSDSDDASSESAAGEDGALDGADPEEAAGGQSSEEDIGDDDESASSDHDPKSGKTSGVLVKDRFGLNDGFFSIDEFNRRTEGWEYADARGNGDAEAASDEEDIDWDINPMDIEPDAADKDGMNESGSDDEDGPIFEDFDSSQGSEAEDGDPMEEDATGNANNIMYAEFFEPPPRKAPKKAKVKKNRDPSPAQESDRDIEETMAMVSRDIFSDEEEDQGELPPGASAHEQRKAAILAQIRELEAENVSKKPWTLSGEARAHDRPINAVLEEDLDFERAGKPVPVVTKETSEGIEELIKRRILASQFDDVRRRRPEEALRAASGRGGSDQHTQSLEAPQKRGLADIYEEEYLRKNDPAFVDQKDEKTAKEHAEIEELWKDIVHKLDSLASFRYRPKRDEITVSVRADAPAMSLEDARPSGVGGAVGTLSQLAPQEIYSAAGEKVAGKVVARGGEVVAREELTREDRRRRRRREKERAKKARRSGAEAGTPEGAKARGAKALVGQLKAGDVKVIGKEGKVKRVDGKDIQTARRGGASLKL